MQEESLNVNKYGGGKQTRIHCTKCYAGNCNKVTPHKKVKNQKWLFHT